MVKERVGRPDQPAGYPPYPAAGTLITDHLLNPPQITVQTNALAPAKRPSLCQERQVVAFSDGFLRPICQTPLRN